MGSIDWFAENCTTGRIWVDVDSTSYHDENDNGKLDADPIGLPTEGYGVSNDAREPLGPPQFSKASFDIGDQGKTITINIKY